MPAHLPSDFTVMADRNDPDPRAAMGLRKALTNSSKMKLMNSSNHNREGQNVLYNDGHVTWCDNPFVGHNEDNIYYAAPKVEGENAGPYRFPMHRTDSLLYPSDNIGGWD